MARGPERANQQGAGVASNLIRLSDVNCRSPTPSPVVASPPLNHSGWVLSSPAASDDGRNCCFGAGPQLAASRFHVSSDVPNDRVLAVTATGLAHKFFGLSKSTHLDHRFPLTRQSQETQQIKLTNHRTHHGHVTGSSLRGARRCLCRLRLVDRRLRSRTAPGPPGARHSGL